MNSILSSLLSLTAGISLGLFFYGGLWWTVRKALVSNQPAIWFLLSLVTRTTACLAGFYVVSGGQWPRLVACLVGFQFARLFVTHLTRPALASLSPNMEGDHAHQP